MLRFQAILLLIIFGLMLIRPAMPFIVYGLRKDYIIENFCINKYEPEMQCNGKCHLKEQVAGNQSEDQTVPLPENKTTFEVPDYLHCQTLALGQLPVIFNAITEYINNYCYQYAMSVFHPPTQEIHPKPLKIS